MAVSSVQDFLPLIEKSNLLLPEQLAEVRTWPEQEPKTLAARMVTAGWITKWQSQQLLAGRSQQFFLGKYKLLELIGQGGMGSVYKAVRPGIGRSVALKVMSRQVLKQPKAVTRFLREIRSAAAVDHPNLVRAYDADCDGDTYFLVMEFVAGRNLKSWIIEEQTLPVGWSCECIRQAAVGLEHAFEQGMVHRDIKPSNLLVTQHEDDGLPLVKILDLGLARFASETQDEGDLTRSGQVLGTPDYIAPEQARNTKTADIRADIFSLGCTLFEMLTGRLPFTGDSVMEKLMARATQDAPSVRLYRPDVPPGLDAVVAQMLARDPQNRFATPAEVARALAPFAIGTAGSINAHSALDSQGSVETEEPVPFTFGSSDLTTGGTLNAFRADLTRATAEHRSRPASATSGIWRTRQFQITAAVVAAVAVLGALASLLPGGKQSSGDAVAKSVHPPKKQKKSLSDGHDGPKASDDGNAAEDPERATALWVLQKGGRLTVVTGPWQGTLAARENASKGHPLASERIEVHSAGELPATTGHLTSVALHGNLQLRKADFDRLADLPHLESLSLTETRFSDGDLARLKSARHLIRLDLQETSVTDAGITQVRSIPTLQALHLGRTHISGVALEKLQSARSLTELNLEGTEIGDADLKNYMPGLSQLQVLNLARTRVRGPGLQFVWRLRDLESLDLSGLHLGPNALNLPRGTAANLKRLELTGAKVTDDGLKLLSGMSSLRELSLDSTQITGDGLKHLTWMPELTRLDLENTVVGDGGVKALGGISSLKSLNLRGTAVSDAGIEHLHGITGLELINLSGTRATFRGVDALQNALPGCKIEY
jgi:serine/threonine protein kinase/uncharacterized protein YjbI with pentapeptide repeats